jgi:predicted Fe-Mo cluster-binding NifX family protein
VENDDMTTGDGTDDRKGMRIAVSSTGESMDSPIDPRFGRCSYFVVVDESGGCKAVQNTGQALGNGAGIQAAQQIVDLGVDTVITGDVGPNAFRVLDAGNVTTYVGCAGTVGSALESYRRGELRRTSTSTSPGHHGQGPRGQGPRGRAGNR